MKRKVAGLIAPTGGDNAHLDTFSILAVLLTADNRRGVLFGSDHHTLPEEKQSGDSIFSVCHSPLNLPFNQCRVNKRYIVNTNTELLRLQLNNYCFASFQEQPNLRFI